MSGDPRECRSHAVRCAELAVEAKSEQLKAHFVGLSKTWENLANELERTQALLAVIDDDPKQPASVVPPDLLAPSQRHRFPKGGRSRQRPSRG
jgi:hypothetical protein